MEQRAVEERASEELAPQRGGDAEGHHLAQVAQPLEVGRASLADDRPVGGADARVVAADDVAVRTLLDGRNHPLEHVGLPPVVAVEKADIPSARARQRRLTGAGHAAVLGREHHEAVVAGGQAPDFGQRAVLRAVVDDDGLEIGVALAPDRFDAGAR